MCVSLSLSGLTSPHFATRTVGFPLALSALSFFIPPLTRAPLPLPHRCHCNGEPAVCNDRSPSCFWSPNTTTSQTTMKTSSSFSSFPAHFRCQFQYCRSELFKINIVSTIFVITNKYCIAFTLYKLVQQFNLGTYVNENNVKLNITKLQTRFIRVYYYLYCVILNFQAQIVEQAESVRDVHNLLFGHFVCVIE